MGFKRRKCRRRRFDYLKRDRSGALIELLEQRQMLTSNWHNAEFPTDVNGDEYRSPLDALLVINELNHRHISDPITGLLPDSGGQVSVYLDVSGDNHVTPHDAQIVIDAINEASSQVAFASAAAEPPTGSIPVNIVANGPETLVNTLTKGMQLNPAADAASPDGQLVVVWGSDDNGGRGVFGQRHDLVGQKVGPEFLVNQTQQGSQSTPDVSVADDGSFVTVWADNSGTDNGWDIYAQMFDADGGKIGPAWQVNETTSGNQRFPGVTHLTDGSFAVTWEGNGPSDDAGVFARIFDETGAATTTDIQVNESSTGTQSSPVITDTPTGFAVAWEGASGADTQGVLLRTFAVNGTALSSTTQVNVDTQGTQLRPTISSNSDGAIIVAFESSQGDGNGNGVFAREFDPNGSASSDVFQINETTLGDQEYPSITYLEDGGFAATWNGKGVSDAQSVYLRTFNDNQDPTSPEILVNETTQSTQEDSIVLGVGSRAVTVWQGRGVGDSDGIYTRLYGVVPKLADIDDQTVAEQDLLELLIPAVGDVTYSLQSSPASLGATIDPVSGLLSWTPNESQGPGIYTLTVSVVDQLDPSLSDSTSFQVNVLEVNLAPTLVLPDAVTGQTIELEDGQTFAFTAGASDSDIPTNSLSFSITGSAPAGIEFDALTGGFTWTPTPAEIGDHSVTLTVTDDGSPNLSDSQTINFQIIPSNKPPSFLPVDDAVINELEEFTRALSASDPNGDDLLYSLLLAPSGAYIDPVSGNFSWIPSEEQGPDSYAVTVEVSDQQTPPLTDSTSFTVEVLEANLPPVLTLPAAIAQQTIQIEDGQLLDFTATASDPDIPANNLTFGFVGSFPLGATLDPVTGEFDWIPTVDQLGLHAITIEVYDDGVPSLADNESFQVEVLPSNRPPELVPIDNVTLEEETELTFLASASDPNGDALQFTLGSGAPDGAALGPNTGEFSWTPTETQGPGVYAVTVEVTDDGTPSMTASTSFEITVLEVNRAPEIQLPESIVTNPLQLEVEDTLQFVATASDPDVPANDLSFYLDGTPPLGATIDASSGEFSWTPGSSQDGTQHFITVGVRDNGSPILSDTETIEVNVGSCPFDASLTGWTTTESGGSSGDQGSVVAQDCAAVLTEGNSFSTTLHTSFVVPELPSDLTVSYAELNFDDADSEFINDAFEIAIVDQNGNALVDTFDSQRDAFFNATEFLGVVSGSDASITGNTITLDLSQVAPGTNATLIIRLVNNDDDTQTSVTITDFSIPGTLGTSVLPSPARLSPSTAYSIRTVGEPGQLNKSVVEVAENASLSMVTRLPYAHVPAGTEVVLEGSVAIVGTQDRTVVQVADANGTIPLDAGNNFHKAVRVLPGINEFEITATDSQGNTATTTVSITGTQNGDALDLGQFIDVSASFTEQYARTSFDQGSAKLYTDVESINSSNHSIATPLLAVISNLSDPTVSVVDAVGVLPVGDPFFDLSDSLAGETLEPIEPVSHTLGFLNPLQETFDYDVVYLAQLNSAPFFETTPVIQTSVGADYAYTARASDLDADQLTLSVLAGPAALVSSFDPVSGELTWTPTTDDIGNHAVTLLVTDEVGNTAHQSFVLTVSDAARNRAPVFVSTPIPSAQYEVVDSESAVVILSAATTTVHHFDNIGSQPRANWTFHNGNTEARQNVNSRASALLLNEPLEAEKIAGSFRVATSSDDDFIGFVFGWQDPTHFYIFGWKQADQVGFGDAGMFVKVVNSDVPLTGGEVWSVGDNGDRATELYRNDIGWSDFVEYGFSLEFDQRGEFRITVSEGNEILDSFNIVDDTYSDGQFGFFNFSQEHVYYQGFRRSPIEDPSYVYDADAIDPDADPVSYGLIEGPEGMFIDRDTGIVGWSPTEEQLLGVGPPTDSSLGNVDGFRVEEYASLIYPTELSVDEFGDVFTGRNSDGGRTAHYIRRVHDGGVERYSNTTITDPDSTYYDLTGEFSGVPGSVLVGGLQSSGSSGKITAVLPDGEVVTIAGPDSAVGNVAHMERDTRGRLLFLNSSNLMAFKDGIVSQVGTISSPGIRGMAVSPDGIIYISNEGGGISSYDLDGNLLNASFGSAGGNKPWSATFSKGGVWGQMLYVIDDQTGELTRFDENGHAEVVGTGFFGGAYLAFGPADVLYIGDYINDRILRVTPTSESLGLRPNEYPVVINASDGRGGVSTQSYSVAVATDPNNSPPVFVSTPVTAGVIGSYAYQAKALDGDDDELRYSIFGDAPSGLAVDELLGTVSWSPSLSQVGEHDVSLLVSDQLGGTDIQSFTIAIQDMGLAELDGTVFDDSNDNGVQDIGENGLPDQTIFIDQNGNGRLDLGEQNTISNAEGSYSFIDLAAGSYPLRWNSQQGFRQTAPTSPLDVILAEAQVVTELDFGVFTVAAGQNSAPEFGEIPAGKLEATIGSEYLFVPTATDPENDPLNFELLTAPDGMSLDRDTGTLAWIPKKEQFGNHDVLLKVSDPAGLADLLSFRIFADLPNSAPLIISSPYRFAATGQQYRYQIDAQDFENDQITFSVLNGPSPTGVGDMQVDVDGLLTWTPDTGLLGSTVNVVVEASDGEKATTQEFSIQVVDVLPNRNPAITSSPRLVTQINSPYAYLVEVLDLDNDPIELSLVSSPAGMELTGNLLSWVPDALGSYQVTVRASDGRGAAAIQEFTLQVLSDVSNSTPSIDSVPPIWAVPSQVYSYDVEASDRDGDPVFWSLDEGPNGMSIDPVKGTLRWIPTIDDLGSNRVVIRATDPSQRSGTQAFDIQVTLTNGTPIIGSIPPTTATIGTPYFYAVLAADPDNDPLTYSIPAYVEDLGASINQQGLLQWTPTSLGIQQLQVLVSDPSGASAFQTYEVNVTNGGAENQPPSITSVPGFFAEVGVEYRYEVEAFDPDGDVLNYSLANPVANAAIDPSTGVLTWTPDAAQVGAFDFQINVFDGSIGSFQTFTVAARTNTAPVISSTAPDVVVAGGRYRYNVVASDAENDRLSYSLATAPAGMTIDSYGRILWDAPASGVSTIPVEVVVTDTRGASDSQAFDLNIVSDSDAPSVVVYTTVGGLQVAGDAEANIGQEVQFHVVATDNVGVDSLTLTVAGQVITLDSNGRGSLVPSTSGNQTVEATATDSSGNAGTTTSSLLVLDPNDVDGPVVAIDSPTPEAVIESFTDVIGTVTDDNLSFYTLSAAPIDSTMFTELVRGTSPVVNGVLGTFDPSTLSNDTYTLRLYAEDVNGRSSVVEQEISVKGDLKLGNFTLSFDDLSVPVTGIPIVVGRTYDTLNANSHDDFGYGWRLEFRDVDLRTSVAKTGFEEDGFYRPFKDEARVYLTLPGGRREGFTFRAELAGGLKGTMGIHYPQFIPDPGVDAQLTVKQYELAFDINGNIVNWGTGIPWNPANAVFGGKYYATTEEGLLFEIDGTSGDLERVIDTNANTLTFTDNAIVSSTGKRVDFVRDSENRITQVIDPIGKAIHYAYDANGDLVSVTDREGNITQIEYNEPSRAHYLTEIIDPLGRTGIRGEYDDTGKLVRMFDADGNETQLIHDIDNYSETIVDALGNSTTYVYDDRGNVLTEIDALGGETVRTYDLENNELTVTDPLGRTASMTYSAAGDVLTETDPLGNTTAYTYERIQPSVTVSGISIGGFLKPFSLQTSITDPLGHATTYDYDGKGNLLAIVDAVGQSTAMNYDASGNLTSMALPGSGVTAFTYDAVGNQVSETDALGNLTAFTHDANGNVLTRSWTQTVRGVPTALSSSNSYDDEGRLLTSTDALGNVTSYEYDANGNQTAVVDALARRTETVYDDRGLAIETIFPDDTPLDDSDNPRTQTQYDALGRAVVQIDELGRETHMVYDELGRVTETILPDDTPSDLTNNPKSTTEYDDAGQVVTSIDPRGNRTEFEYDDAGRQTLVRDPLSFETTFVFDDAGRQVSTTDANANTTSFVYDALGRQVETQFADGEMTRSQFDDTGRLEARIDQLGRVTTYGYDDLGRLTSVLDADGGLTVYTYNESGGLLTQTDANGHATSYEYDELGRRVAEILPLGQRSVQVYDEVGRMVAATDFNGDTIVYEYDARGRMTAKRFPDSTATTLTYTPTGQRSSVTDSRGLTSYNYDAQDRLLSRTDPDGRLISYTYDIAGNQTSVTVPSGTTSYTFDVLNRMETVSDPQGGITTYDYDPVGALTTTTFPNGVIETREYDELNRLLYLESSNDNGVFDSYRYTLNATGNRVNLTDVDGRNVEYEYDPLDRLEVERIFNAGSSTATRTITYEYDAAGNRLSRIDTAEGTSIYVYDDNDRLLQDTDEFSIAQAVYTYDNNGSTITKTVSGITTRYSWDFEQRLVDVDLGDDGVVDVMNEYDIDNIRVSRMEGGQKSLLMIDSNRPYSQVLEEYTPTGTVLSSYQYGRNLIAWNQTSIKLVFHVDGLGSTTTLTDSSGSITDHYSYDAFGQVIQHDGQSENAFLFTGQYRDQTLGLDYLRARWLNPNTGRFQSRDSFPPQQSSPTTLHRYLYANGNPVSLVDPGGNFAIGALLSFDSFLTALPTSPTFSTLVRANKPGVFVQAHVVTAELLGSRRQLPNEHLSIKLVPQNLSRVLRHFPSLKDEFRFRDIRRDRFATLGAGPEPLNNPVLVSRFNRKDDVNQSNKTELVRVVGNNIDAAILRLIVLENTYSDNSDYAIVPGFGYTSNSYVTGILQAAGIPRPSFIATRPWDFIGAERPLPIP